MLQGEQLATLTKKESELRSLEKTNQAAFQEIQSQRAALQTLQKTIADETAKLKADTESMEAERKRLKAKEAALVQRLAVVEKAQEAARLAKEAEQRGREVHVADVRLTAPLDWVRKAPQVEFIRAEFTLPRAEDDAADARLTVTVAGGGLKENVDRWRTRFSEKPEKEAQEQLKVDGVDVTLVDFSGTYSEQLGGAPAVERSEYRMLGAIFYRGGQPYFIKAVGPAKTMALRASGFRAFVNSLKVDQPSSIEQQLPVQLSAGTALPQTLPEGTSMGFSVDYQFTAGQPEPDAQYFWVIQRTQGASAKQPVRLKPQGTLQGFIADFRPEHGPFQAHIEDGRGRPISVSVPLR